MTGTTVTAVAARAIGFDTFDGLLPDGCSVLSVRPAAGLLLAVEFSCELDAATVTAVRDRMTSRNDVDQAARANLRELHDAVVDDPSLANIAALTLANTHYLLGDQQEG